MGEVIGESRRALRPTRAARRELAAVVALGTLEGRWKAIKSRGGAAAAVSGDTDLLIAVEFRGMSEWQDISRRLSATAGIEQLEVAGLKGMTYNPLTKIYSLNQDTDVNYLVACRKPA